MLKGVRCMTSKEKNLSPPAHFRAAFLGLVGGLVIAVWISPRNEYFLGNFAMYWLPHGAVLAILLLFKAQKAVFAGAAIAMALYLSLFSLWYFRGAGADPTAMAWLGYLFSFPGALFGAVFAIFYGKRSSSIIAVLLAFGWVALGLAINQTVVCSTVMYCLGS